MPESATNGHGRIDRRKVAPILRSEGQRLLLAVDASTSAIGRALDVSAGLVSDWRNGRRFPGPEMKAALSNLYGIEPVAWSVRPGVATAAVAAAVAEAEAAPEPFEPIAPAVVSEPTLDTAIVHGGAPSSLQSCMELLAALRHDRAQPNLTPAARVKLSDAEARILALRARLEAAQELAEDRYVRQHPAWIKTKRAILAALEPYPEAAAAVVTALRGIGDGDNDDSD